MRSKKKVRISKSARKRIRNIDNRTVIERMGRFGKESRFVNKVGSVPSSATEMFGCEIVRNLPEYVYTFIKELGHDVVIKVPVSNPEGLTGSGKNGECHLNSKLMSLLNGGNRLLGLSVLIPKERKTQCFLLGHSVWNTPEGKTRCVTVQNMSQEMNDLFIWGDYVLFVPVGLNDIDEDNDFWINDFIINEYTQSDCIMSKDLEGDYDADDLFDNKQKYVTDRTDLKKSFEKKGYVFSTFRHKERKSFLNSLKDSYFSKKSLSTGKSWGYYKNKILRTYFPQQISHKY